MLKKIIITSGLLAACTFMSAHAAAQSYFGGSIGRAKWDLDCTGIAGRCQTAAASAKLFGGYEISPYFGVEGSYLYLNEVTANSTNAHASVNGRGFDIAGVVKTPVASNFSGFAKLGLAFMKGEVQASSIFGSGSETHYSSQPLVGFGAMYHIDKKMKIRAEIDRRNVKVTGLARTTFAVTNFSFGLQSEF